MAVSAFEIFFAVNGKYYLGGTIRTSHDKSELFFHFPWGSRSPGLSKSVDATTALEGYLPDHISFQRDGQIHATRRDIRKKINYENSLALGLNPFNLPCGRFLPIYLESISMTSAAAIAARLRRVDPTQEQKNRAWDLSAVGRGKRGRTYFFAVTGPGK